MSRASRKFEMDTRILNSYALHDGDISTPRLLQMIADDCGCDVGRVTDALYRESQRQTPEPQA